MCRQGEKDGDRESGKVYVDCLVLLCRHSIIMVSITLAELWTQARASVFSE